MKRVIMATALLLTLFAGICFAATYTVIGETVSGSWTTGWSELLIRDRLLPGSTTANGIWQVRANSTTIVNAEQQAWGVYMTCYTSDRQVLGMHNEPLDDTLDFMTVYPRSITWNEGEMDVPLIVNLGPSPTKTVKITVDTTHRSAEHKFSGLNHEVIISTAQKDITLWRHMGLSPAIDGTLDEGTYILKDGKLVQVPKYDTATLRNDLANAISVEGATVVFPEQMREVIDQTITIPGWTLEGIKSVLSQIHSYEVSKITPGDSLPIYLFDNGGLKVTIGFKQLDGTFTLGAVLAPQK